MIRRFIPHTLLLSCALAFPALAVDDFRNPEIATHNPAAFEREAVQGTRYMISAANPLAAEAGAKILREGGNAVDAAIATQLVLNVVEPQSSGIGGGGFMLYWDAGAKKLHIYDGRETAPAAVNEGLFLDSEGKPLAFEDAMKGGHSVGTPGLLKMLDHAHKRHGVQEWQGLFSDAIRLSRDGFPMSPRLHQLLSSTAHIKDFSTSMRPFLDEEGTLIEINKPTINKEISESLSLISRQGIAAFYEGELAEKIATTVQESPHNPGKLTAEDLHNYAVVEREPVCAPYRSYTICSMPPPSSGGVTIMQALGIIERLTTSMDIRMAGPVSEDAAHLLAEASKLAYADRNRYLADPAFEDVPTAELLAPNYIRERAELIRFERAMPEAAHGIIGERKAAAVLTTEEHPSTTHISIVDSKGNAVAMTTSIEQGFGSGLSAAGFLLNNQMTDFNFVPTLPDGVTPHPNRVEPLKRPRSSMSPTMVFDDSGELVMVIGSPGGARIITYVLQTLVAVLDWNLDIQQAINLPRYLNMNGPTELEGKTNAAMLEEPLKRRGHEVRVTQTPSGLHGITLFDGVLQGGADPRREGVAIGE